MADNLDCSGCKISMFCHKKDPDAPQETNLNAVLVAFGIPLLGCILILVGGQNSGVGEGITALGILSFLALYYFVLWILKPQFRNC